MISNKYFFSIIFLYYLSIIYAREIFIGNNDTSFIKLNEILNNNHGDDLYLYFTDDYYEMKLLGNIQADVEMKKIMIIGSKNGTVFDYKDSDKGTFCFTLMKNMGTVITVQNIIFENYLPPILSSIKMFTLSAHIDNYQLIFDNCIFRNNGFMLIKIDGFYTKKTQDIPQVQFTNCIFL